MFLIVSNGVQIVGSFNDPDEAQTAYDALVSEHPESTFAIFDKIHPVENEPADEPPKT